MFSLDYLLRFLKHLFLIIIVIRLCMKLYFHGYINDKTLLDDLDVILSMGKCSSV